MTKFKIEDQYQQYLKKVGLKEENMHPTQRVETKRAFMAGCGQMLVLLRDEIGELEEDDAVEQMGSLLNQVSEFWIKESNQLN
ncbi:MAG: hypothetical protein WBA59_03760 [Moheibacter sp.]